MGRAHRIPGVDYSSPGCYFITAVTADRYPFLGRLRDGSLIPSPIGCAVETAWRAIPTFRPWITVGPFTLMPDHIHGMLWWHHVPEGRDGDLGVVILGLKADGTRRAREAGLFPRGQRLWQRSMTCDSSCHAGASRSCTGTFSTIRAARGSGHSDETINRTAMTFTAAHVNARHRWEPGRALTCAAVGVPYPIRLALSACIRSATSPSCSSHIASSA